MSKFKKKDSYSESMHSEENYDLKKNKKSVNEGILANGEKLSKADKIFASIGTLEELNAYIGLVKAQFYNSQQSYKIFLFARLTQIQETILYIIGSLSTSKKNLAQYEKTRFSRIYEKNVAEIQEEINKITNASSSTNSSNEENKCLEKKDYLMILPGQSVVQSHLLYIRTLIRRSERQIIASKNQNLGLIPEEEIIKYLNILGDFFLFVANSKNN